MSSPGMLIDQYAAATGIDPAADWLLIDPGGTGTYKKINRNTLLGVGVPVGTTETQTVQNKTFDNTNAATLKSSGFTLEDAADTTKQLAFSLAVIATGNKRTLTVPDASDTLVLLGATQTLTGKTLTAPVISGGSIDNATITVDSVAGHTTANAGTIYGVSIAGGVISTANSVAGAALTVSSVTPSKLNTGAAHAAVATSETTTSTSYTDLATTTDDVTVTIGANGLALVTLSANISNNTLGDSSFVSFAASGANTIAASDANAIAFTEFVANYGAVFGNTFLLTGLSGGSTTFKMKYKVSGGTGTFLNRQISVVPL